MSPYQILIVVTTSIGILSCLAFVLGYWWVTRGTFGKAEAGRYFMTSMSNKLVLFSLVLSGILWGDWPGRKVLILILYVSFVATTWWPLRLLILAQRRKSGDYTS